MPAPAARNPGPDWGCGLMIWLDRFTPEVVFRPIRMIGTWVAVAAMPGQRAHSRHYLATIHGREPTRREVFRHFFAFTEFLMLRLRIGGGQPHHSELAPAAEAEGLRDLLVSAEPALLGSFHVGYSDLAGFLFGPQEGRRIFMVRQRVGNSRDTEVLAERFGKWVTFIWVTEQENLLFALKDAVAAGGTMAMKCDRLGFSAKTETFHFLGAKRVFPFTIYHLALIFRLPVVLCLGIPKGENGSVVYSSPLFRPDGAGKAANLERARAHFQEFLTRLEGFLRTQPELWFNFIPLNPVAP
ncbi:MAG: hypothetical protein V4773_26105 [Verrucomicrobiota bacterium]